MFVILESQMGRIMKIFTLVNQLFVDVGASSEHSLPFLSSLDQDDSLPRNV